MPECRDREQKRVTRGKSRFCFSHFRWLAFLWIFCGSWFVWLIFFFFASRVSELLVTLLWTLFLFINLFSATPFLGSVLDYLSPFLPSICQAGINTLFHILLSTSIGTALAYIQPGAVKLVLWRHWTHVTQVHPVTSLRATNFTAPGCTHISRTQTSLELSHQHKMNIRSTHFMPWLKVHCHAIQCFYVDFFAVENGGEETQGRGADQRLAGLGRNFIFHLFGASRLMDVGVSVSCPCKVIPLSRTKLGYDQESEKTSLSLPINNGEKFMEFKTGLQSSTDWSWVARFVRQSFKTCNLSGAVVYISLHSTVIFV